MKSLAADQVPAAVHAVDADPVNRVAACLERRELCVDVGDDRDAFHEQRLSIDVSHFNRRM
jgi:hypothetical protein